MKKLNILLMMKKTCIIKGLDRFGQLILEDAKGNLKSYGYKELKFL